MSSSSQTLVTPRACSEAGPPGPVGWTRRRPGAASAQVNVWNNKRLCFLGKCISDELTQMGRIWMNLGFINETSHNDDTLKDVGQVLDDSKNNNVTMEEDENLMLNLFRIVRFLITSSL